MASSPPPSPDNRFSPTFCPFSHRQSTLPEHHSALSVIHQLDHSWFWDNVLYLPGFPSCLPIAPSSPPPHPPSPPAKLSPFQSIELVQSLHPSLMGSYSNDSELPRARFERLPRRRTVEKNSDGSAQQSLPRRLRKQFGEIHIQVPRRQLGKTPLRERLVSNELAEESTSGMEYTHLGGTDDNKDFEPIPYKGNQTVEKLNAPKLDSIASGKQLRACPDDTCESMMPVTRRHRRDRRKSSKSMTDLEVDELQGFMDLGFQFSKEDLTPRVVTLFPALRRQLGEDGEQGRSSRVIPSKANPYRSEAWLIRRPDSPLLNWRIPAPTEGRAADMKVQLKFWARAVASTVRQEC